MSANPAQVLPVQQFTTLEDYQFSGDDVTVENKRNFIDRLREKAAVYLAAQAAGVSKMTAYRWRDADPQFAAAWDEAQEDSIEVMQSSVYERALGSNGNKPDSLLAMFWLKAHAPKYRDKLQIDVATVQDEIAAMMAKYDQRQLPAAVTEFIDTSYSQGSNEYAPVESDTMQNSSRLDNQQKEDSPPCSTGNIPSSE